MSKPREFWFDDYDTDHGPIEFGKDWNKPLPNGAVHVIEKLAYDKAIRKLQESEAALESVLLDKLAQLSVLEDKIAIAVEALVTLESHVYAYGIEQESFAVAMACEKTKKALRKINSSHNVHSHSTKSEWQPIETAPLDSYVIVYDPECSGIVTSYWSPEDACWVDCREPTHWMPLPKWPNEDQHHGCSRCQDWKEMGLSSTCPDCDMIEEGQ